MKKKIMCLLMGMFLMLIFTKSGNTAPFQNGSFEVSSVEPNDYYLDIISVHDGDTYINGWNVEGSITLMGDYWTASQGSRSINLEGRTGDYPSWGNILAGSVLQTFDTTPGKLYDVSFDIAGNPDATSHIDQTLQASAGSYTGQYTFNINGKNKSNMGWETYSFTFSANENLTTLKFASFTGGDHGGGPALDNVNVLEHPNQPAVPEPGTILLLGLGLVGLAGLRRKV